MNSQKNWLDSFSLFGVGRGGVGAGNIMKSEHFFYILRFIHINNDRNKLNSVSDLDVKILLFPLG
jgi:cell division GTPase FtsZ